MYMGVVWCGKRKSGKTPPFSPIFQPICMQMCPLHMLRKGKGSKPAQSKLLNFYVVFTWFLPEKHFGPLLRSYKRRKLNDRSLNGVSVVERMILGGGALAALVLRYRSTVPASLMKYQRKTNRLGIFSDLFLR